MRCGRTSAQRCGRPSRRSALAESSAQGPSNVSPWAILRWRKYPGRCSSGRPQPILVAELILVITSGRTERRARRRRLLREAIDRVAATQYESHYQDGTKTTLSIKVEPPTAACGGDGLTLPTSAHFETADGKVSATVPVFLNPAFSRLNVGSRDDFAWVFPPAQLSQHGVNVEADLTSLAHVGIHAGSTKLRSPPARSTCWAIAPATASIAVRSASSAAQSGGSTC